MENSANAMAKVCAQLEGREGREQLLIKEPNAESRRLENSRETDSSLTSHHPVWSRQFKGAHVPKSF